MKTFKWIILLGIAGMIAATGYIASGWYPIGADVPHNKATYWLLETLRERSIARAAANIKAPNLNDPELLLTGGADYNDMCAQCHLKPGKHSSDMSIGLYPSPPNLSLASEEHGHGHKDLESNASRQFWIIKHGIKASGMPAWGPSHSDDRIWAMVAFLQKLPTLNAEQYQIITARDVSEPMQH